MRSAPVPSNRGTDPTPQDVAAQLLDAFGAYHHTFRAVTRRARGRFEDADWAGVQRDGAERLALYKLAVATAVQDIKARLGGTRAAPFWAEAKAAYGTAVCERADAEIAETFFNSVVRRIQGTIGGDPLTTFVESTARPRRADPGALYETVECAAFDASTIARILAVPTWDIGYLDPEGDAARAAEIVAADLIARCAGAPIDGIDVLRAPFYRNKGAYLVARVRSGRRAIPLIIALARRPEGIVIDAVLPTPDEASIVFGVSWTYFSVETQDPGGLVVFLRSIMPHKRIDELYTAIGYNRHGKTELYRSLMRHLAEHPDARFAPAEGDEGTVMSVFALPSFNVVVKVIKDRFAPPKTTTRRAVMDRYHFVFVRDRVGRLADAQEFEFLEFPVTCFTTPLLDHLLATCAETVHVAGDRVVVQHAYTERKVTPLNLFLKSAPLSAARHAVLDYGQAIKDLAGADIFTGDMLLKNFGVSRHGRVICYDYDELTLLAECQFRHLPPPVHEEDEWAAEPAFYVGEGDVFPEEFRSFLVPPGALRDAFLDAHSDLLSVRYWRDMQARLRTGEILDVFPYQASRRLRRWGPERAG